MAGCDQSLQNRLNSGNHIELVQIQFPANPGELNDLLVKLSKPCHALYYPDWGAPTPVVGLSFNPIGYQIKVAAPGNPTGAALIKFNPGVSWQFEEAIQFFYLTVQSAGGAGILTLMALEGLDFHGPQS